MIFNQHVLGYFANVQSQPSLRGLKHGLGPVHPGTIMPEQVIALSGFCCIGILIGPVGQVGQLVA
jgi:hypothetical protein